MAKTSTTNRKKPPTSRNSTEKSDKPKTMRLNVNIPKDLYRDLRIRVAEEETSVSKAVIALIEDYVSRK